LSDDYEEIKSYAEKIGSNIYLHDRKVVFSFKNAFSLIPNFLTKNRFNQHFLSNAIDKRTLGTL